MFEIMKTIALMCQIVGVDQCDALTIERQQMKCQAAILGCYRRTVKRGFTSEDALGVCLRARGLI
jgi:hypothetical protein